MIALRRLGRASAKTQHSKGFSLSRVGSALRLTQPTAIRHWPFAIRGLAVPLVALLIALSPVQAVDHARAERLADDAPIPPVLRRVHVEHDRSDVGQVLQGRVAQERPLLLGRKETRVAADEFHVVVLGDGPEPGAIPLLVPEHGGLATEHLEHVVWHRVLEDVRVREVDVAELHLVPPISSRSPSVYVGARPQSKAGGGRRRPAAPARRGGRRGRSCAHSTAGRPSWARSNPPGPGKSIRARGRSCMPCRSHGASPGPIVRAGAGC